MSKDEQKIIVVERDKLFKNDYFQGFSSNEKIDYESRILSNLKIMKRGDAEEDPSHKQPIGYISILNPGKKEIFVYQRSSKDKEYGEKRLQGKLSFGVGGHIEDFEYKTENPIKESTSRELFQEIEIIGNAKNPIVLGYINDDKDSVGKVHFGLWYVVSSDKIFKVIPKDKEIERGEMMHIEKLEEIIFSPDYEFEGWSKILLEPLKEYFNRF